MKRRALERPTSGDVDCLILTNTRDPNPYGNPSRTSNDSMPIRNAAAFALHEDLDPKPWRRLEEDVFSGLIFFLEPG